MTAVAHKEETDLSQRKASDPNASAWVSANAGAGKTYVLVRRVLRLLLGATTPPERILCLTYTRAAAGEMENRLYDTLSHWATMDDAALTGELTDLQGRAPDAAEITRARQLFAIALDTKGGLKIYTVHAFCERLLHRFPLEAGIVANFRVLDEQEQRALLDAATAEVLARAARDGAALGPALGHVIAATGEDQFRKVVAAVLDRQEALRRLHAYAGDSATLGQQEREDLARVLGAGDIGDQETVVEEMATVLNDDAIDEALEALTALPAEAKTDLTLQAALEKARATTSAPQRVGTIESLFLTQKGTPRATLMTKTVREAFPHIAEQLEAARDRFHELAVKRSALRVATVSSALLELADAIFDAYEARKQARAALDYDDLVVKTASLLQARDTAAWVLYKLDRGLDHVLVDEAQDTSPVQWRVIAALVDEFFAGEGAGSPDRTVFAVGDEKQSIYSFQGANPAEFAEQGRSFARHAENARRLWHKVPLNLSFRSTETVLGAVDDVFAQDAAADGLTWQDAPVTHTAFREGQAGLVEVWPVEQPAERTDARPFAPHEDVAAGDAAADRLVTRIAETVAGWIGTEQLTSQDRPIRPDDILILLARRNPLGTPLIRALKCCGVPVAGADRMRLTEQLAVMDLMVLGDFLLLPEDDLALATVLKSPLFGLDDDDLFALAHERPGTLWRSLRDKALGEPRFQEAKERLEAWLARADYMPPFEFYAGLLEDGGMDMRRRLIRRLGPDAGDALDEFLNVALVYDDTAPPSLEGFLAALRSSDAEIKRDMEQVRDEVRVMTVHGAKGLEANIVILPDTCRVPASGGNRPTVLDMPRRDSEPDAPEHLVWVPPETLPLEEIDAAKARRKAAERQEYHRLLYVAMTRARDRLYVCGFEGGKARDAGCWYDLVFDGLKPTLKEATDAKGRLVWRIEGAQTASPKARTPSEAPADADAPLPEWIARPAPDEPARTLLLAPSGIAGLETGAPGLAEQDVSSPLTLGEPTRFLRGALVHTLLEQLPELPEAQWDRAATAFAEARGGALDPDLRREIVDETLAILRHPDFAGLFRPASRAEVPVVAHLPDPDGTGAAIEVSGQIDRLVVQDDAVLIVDYKTNRPPPTQAQDVAPAYLAQLAAYRAAIGQLFPGRPVRCALLWTAGPRLMPIPDALLQDHEAHIRPASRTLDAADQAT